MPDGNTYRWRLRAAGGWHQPERIVQPQDETVGGTVDGTSTSQGASSGTTNSKGETSKGEPLGSRAEQSTPIGAGGELPAFFADSGGGVGGLLDNMLEPGELSTQPVYGGGAGLGGLGVGGVGGLGGLGGVEGVGSVGGRGRGSWLGREQLWWVGSRVEGPGSCVPWF